MTGPKTASVGKASMAGTVFPVGVLPRDGEARFTLPASVVGRYQAIDVSLEADDSDPTHSKHSLLRGRYA